MKQISRYKSTISRVLKYIDHYKGILLLSLVFASISVALTLYVPILVGQSVDHIIGVDNVDFVAVFNILKKIGIIVLMTAVLQWLMNVCNNKITYNVIRDVRVDAFEKLQILPLKYMDSHPSGEIVSRVISDVDQFSDGLLMGFRQLFTGFVAIIGTIIFMLTINVKITLIVVCLTPLSLLVAKYIASKTFSMFKLQSMTRAEQTAIIDETITNMKVVKAFSQESNMTDKFDEVNERNRQASLNAIFYSATTFPATRFVNSIVYTSVGVAGAFFAINGYLSIGGLTSFLSYANQYTKPFNEISGVITELQNALVCASRIFELIDETPQTPDVVSGDSISQEDTDVNIENVCFSYTEDKKLIENLNINVIKGQKIAIVGPTGCGKTTLINLLMRFYDVNSGAIKITGKDIRNLTRKNLRQNYGMVLQETWLKLGTIKDNIVMGKPDATMDQVISAAKASNAHSFITKLPYGYDTIIGEDGGSLSQGQKQLLCITRIMLCLPPILILDEATSSIDTRTEIKIQEAFTRLMKGRTSFVVAHRLSTIKEADVILVMKDGNIVEQGNHNELLSAGGFYHNLYNSQFDLG